ncbi:MAG: MBL fold metallo-hydrolase [Candidatus Heimdallarchaeota archaeon]
MATKISIVYDDQASKGFITGWGFSAVIEKDDNVLLFDAGWDGIALLKNLEKANFDPKKFSHIIISHKHWDHIGGLNAVLYETNNPTVFVPSSISSRLKAEITKFAELREVVDVKAEVTSGIWTTPQMKTDVEDLQEISLLIQTKKGLVVVCGCSHPGLDKIIELSNKYGKVHAVIGGFHGFENLDCLKNIDVIIPCHCTKKKNEILEKYPKKSKKCHSGLVVTFE